VYTVCLNSLGSTATKRSAKKYETAVCYNTATKFISRDCNTILCIHYIFIPREIAVCDIVSLIFIYVNIGYTPSFFSAFM
jgi:hypothetical protein